MYPVVSTVKPSLLRNVTSSWLLTSQPVADSRSDKLHADLAHALSDGLNPCHDTMKLIAVSSLVSVINRRLTSRLTDMQMLFMAVTSSGSAELIAVSSLFTYDVYRTYINPEATAKQIITFSRICVVVFGLLMGILAVLLNVAGVSLGWVYLAMGAPEPSPCSHHESHPEAFKQHPERRWKALCF